MRLPALASLAVASLAFVAPAAHADAPLTLTIKAHKFVPDQLAVPAGKKFILVVVNADPTGEEFESSQLHREKLVAANASIKVHLGPLKPGSYHFFGDFHKDTAEGDLIAK